MGLLHSVGVVLHPTRMNADAIGTLLAWAEAADLPVYGLPDEVGRIDCAAVAGRRRSSWPSGPRCW